MAGNRMVKAWVVKYLSDMVLRVDGYPQADGMLAYRLEGGPFQFVAGKTEWFRSKRAALAAAERQRQERLADLRSIIADLEALQITPYDASGSRRRWSHGG